MPPTRSARVKHFVAPTTSTSVEVLAAVPAFDSAEERVHWVYKLRHISRTTYIKPVNMKAPKKTQRCSLCARTFNGDAKTMDRHELTDEHLLQVARVQHIDFETLRAPRIPCTYCGKGIAGKRKDSHKRHVGNCRENPSRAVLPEAEDTDGEGSAKPLHRTRSLTQAKRERKSTTKAHPLGRSVSMPEPGPSSLPAKRAHTPTPPAKAASPSTTRCVPPQPSRRLPSPPVAPSASQKLDASLEPYLLWPPTPAATDTPLPPATTLPPLHSEYDHDHDHDRELPPALRLPIAVAVKHNALHAEYLLHHLPLAASVAYDPLFPLGAPPDLFDFEAFGELPVLAHSPEELSFDWLLQEPDEPTE